MDQSLEHKRHTLAHLMAAAILKRYPNAKTTLGPAIDDGFYYDIDFGDGEKPGEADLKKIEKDMKKLLPTWKEFSHEVVSKEKALEWAENNEYKKELIEEIADRGEDITLYTAGDFTDLCRGGHSENPAKDIDKDAFILDRVAGAYWRGDENNTMLTRIYGLAFETKQELDEYLEMREEARKRDHKKLGKELDLFTFSDLVGGGLPLWTPRGTIMRNLLDDFVWELRQKYDYQKVEIPHITKKDLYQVSGHWDKFADELFRITTREGHEFAMKPMNCPHHTQIYARRQWSYRELPQRYANSTACYRDEQSGELSGLSRVRAFTQDDAHVFCRMSQAKEEFLKVWDIVHSFYPAFGFNLQVRLSRHDPEQPEKYLGDKKIWEKAETMLKEIAEEKQVETIDGLGEAAFYGPKLDFMAKDSLGREWQVATIQLDMNLPERFDLTCINENGEHERIVMIHAAIMGSIERFAAVLIEHLGGMFPLWLSPVQVKVLPVSEHQAEYAESVASKLKEAGIRVELDAENESLGKRIRQAKLEKVPYLFVVGDKEVESETVAVENRQESEGSKKLEEVITELQEKIKTRSL